MSVESYKHKAAKAVFAGWLRDAAEDAGIGNVANCLGIQWHVDRTAPFWGVWEEYPIVNSVLNTQIPWDEMDYRMPREDEPEADSPWANGPPTYKFLASQGTYPKVILDIAVHHRGQPTTLYGIEIVHTNGLSEKKRRDLQGMRGLFVICVDAEWVLRQVGKPDRLNFIEAVQYKNILTRAA